MKKVLESLLFEKSVRQSVGCRFSKPLFSQQSLEKAIPQSLLRKKPARLPELSENEVVRHFTALSVLNYHIDKGVYPLGSCTMKYNPRLNEAMARLPGFSMIHPFQDEKTVPGALKLMYQLADLLAKISGLDQVTLQPAAGAHGEMTAAMIMRAYFKKQGQSRNTILIPDSAHGTNPATAALAGFSAVTVESGDNGMLNLLDLEKKINPDVAALMITNPNTLGIFELQIEEIQKKLHDNGSLLYLDGANMNALLGLARPGDMGFDIMHFNLHKTFSTPHGGGGPGAGPVGVKDFLTPFLPTPIITKKEDQYFLDENRPDSIGRVHSFYGNFLVLVRAYTYIMSFGRTGLKEISKNAILNSNYLHFLIKDLFDTPYPGPFMHEFVVSALPYKEFGIKTLDIAKRLLDYGFYAPTIYFPLIVPEALMIEPTESESRESLEKLANALRQICQEAKKDPHELHTAPHNTPVERLNEAKAARDLVVIWPES